MPKKKAENNFESSFKKLEQVVEKLEAEELALDQALKLYEEGVKLSRFCTAKLEEAEKRVQKLARNKQGNLVTEELDLFAANPDDNASKESTQE